MLRKRLNKVSTFPYPCPKTGVDAIAIAAAAGRDSRRLSELGFKESERLFNKLFARA
jgi:hypothetical protein